MEAKRCRVSVLRLIVIWCWACCGCLDQIPIPARTDGFVYGRTPPTWGGTVLVEAFFDPVCPDSREAWPPLKKAVEQYGASVSVVVHLFPLPWVLSNSILPRCLWLRVLPFFSSYFSHTYDYLFMRTLWRVQKRFNFFYNGFSYWLMNYLLGNFIWEKYLGQIIISPIKILQRRKIKDKNQKVVWFTQYFNIHDPIQISCPVEICSSNLSTPTPAAKGKKFDSGPSWQKKHISSMVQVNRQKAKHS
jgi:hypothetical protein